MDWGSPLLESNRVSYITPAYDSSMQELIMQEMQQKWQKSCFRCKTNTWYEMIDTKNFSAAYMIMYDFIM